MSPEELSGKVQTVLGPIAPESLGVTMTHEHLLVDLRCYFERPDEASERAYVHAPVTMDVLGRISRMWLHNLDNLFLGDIDAAIGEALLYKNEGGGSLVEATSRGIGRDPLGLARISRATGLNVIMGAGYYVPQSHPPDMDDKSEDEITEEIVRDITVGVGDTGIRSGIIGEIGCTWPLQDNVRKVLRASARAQSETGACILIHPGPEDECHQAILDVLVSAGARPQRVIMGHLDGTLTDLGLLKSLAETGCFLEYDNFSKEDSHSFLSSRDRVNDVQRIEKLAFLAENGHVDQLVVAQDVCTKHHYTRYGGKGYAHILNEIVPRMRTKGFSEADVEAILVDNPRRALTFDAVAS